MAIGKVRESVEAQAIVCYVGSANAKVIACNPDMVKRNTLLNIESDKEPVYVGERDVEGVKYPQATITFYVQPDYTLEDGESKPVIPVTFFVTKRFRYNKDKSKVQVIDKYGLSGWATQEECQNHTALVSKDGKPLRITTAYRPAYDGEIELVDFIRNYLNIEEPLSYINESWVANPKVADMDECECSFDIDKLFSGNFSEMQEVPKYAPDNEFKGVFGIRRDDKGNLFQMMFTRKTLRKGARTFSEIDKEIKKQKNNGGMKNVDIDVLPFRVYTPNITSFNNTPTEAPSVPNSPFGPAPTGASPFSPTGTPVSNPTISPKTTPWG